MNTKGKPEQILVTPFTYLLEVASPENNHKPAAPRAGDPCSQCGEAALDYDGLLNLVCPRCGYLLAGCFT